MNTPGAAGTAGDGFRVPVREGRHRAAPPPPNPPTAAWWTVAVAAGALVVACVAAIAVDVAPKASAAGVHGTHVPTVTRAQETAGPLEMPTIGVVAPAVESLYPTTEKPLSRPRSVLGVQGHAPAPQTTAAGLSEAAQPTVTTSDDQEPSVTPPPQPVSEDQPAAPPTDDAAEDPSSATPTEETPVTPEPTATPSADVTVEVTP